MNPEQIQEVKDTFPDADLSLIEEIIYFNGWNGYEEHGGILIFKAIDDSFQLATYGNNVFSEDTKNYFDLYELSQEEAVKEISDMEVCIERNNLEMEGVGL